MNKYTVLPLLNSSFEPGKALETVEQFEDKDFRNIAMAELYYFTGKAKECCEITELYLENEKMELRLSACMLYCYANLTLGRSVASKRGLQGIQECISKAMKKEISEELQASCVLAGYVGAVLLHLPAEGIPPLWEYSGILSEGLRLFAVYVLAHQAYLNGEYWSAYGMCKAALFMTRETYPISMVYLRCMMSTCRINRRYKKEAQIDLMEGWKMAEKDDFVEPFIEHHGLFQGLIEVCIRKNDPDAYKRITDGVLSFSRGWMAVHNPETKNKVTDELTVMEFSIAMQASGGWTNKEIAAHMGISVNTVKHYLTDIFCKLDIKKREELKQYMLN